jgi:GNAT superfamily N-acetyltransferase
MVASSAAQTAEISARKMSTERRDAWPVDQADQVAQPAPDARAVLATDRAAIAAMLARAFRDDPVMVFMFPDAADRAAKLPRLFALLLDSALPFGGCDIARGGETASIWRPPGRTGISLWEILRHLRAFFSIYGFAGARRALSLLAAMERCHPPEPHWYLMVLGTEPERQGKGFGGIVLRRRLVQIDRAHLPAYLEASRPENVPIYASVGFEPRGELPIPRGPVIYPMFRPAR